MPNGTTFNLDSARHLHLPVSGGLPTSLSEASTLPPSPYESFGPPNDITEQGHGVASSHNSGSSSNRPPNPEYERLIAALNSNKEATNRLVEQLEPKFKEVVDKILINYNEQNQQHKKIKYLMFFMFIKIYKEIEKLNRLSTEHISKNVHIVNEKIEKQIAVSQETNKLLAKGNKKRIASVKRLKKKFKKQLAETQKTNELLAVGNNNRAAGVKQLEKANEEKPLERPKAAFPEWISKITESTARRLANLVKDTPWAKNALKGICYTSETLMWLTGLGLSLQIILPPIIYGTITSLSEIGLIVIALLALATVGKHFMACLKYELNHTPLASDAVEGTTAKAAA